MRTAAPNPVDAQVSPCPSHSEEQYACSGRSELCALFCTQRRYVNGELNRRNPYPVPQGTAVGPGGGPIGTAGTAGGGGPINTAGTPVGGGPVGTAASKVGRGYA